jgi:glycosyltransferase involved in cell wall biosynthesis
MGLGAGAAMQAVNPVSVEKDRPDVQTPLVSVGIPTYNRPAGLRRTLGQICGQTYSNLEIIVSDNASPDPETESVAREFAAVDPRIKYFRQPENRGPLENFRFVLARATGDYFMWAADDDEWDEKFIETCMSMASPSCSVMTKFNTIFRFRDYVEENPMPPLSPDASLFQNVQNYFALMQPSLFYGIHPRKSVLFVLSLPYFDFHDCYVILRILLETNFRTIDKILHSAGIDTPVYQIKYADPKLNRFTYWPFFWRCCLALIGCRRLSLVERVKLVGALRRTVLQLRDHHERVRVQAA